ncbi:MAG: hypothetical protein V1847_01940 [Candidatus Diapherotrites archaeon]
MPVPGRKPKTVLKKKKKVVTSPEKKVTKTTTVRKGRPLIRTRIVTKRVPGPVRVVKIPGDQWMTTRSTVYGPSMSAGNISGGQMTQNNKGPFAYNWGQQASKKKKK